MISAPLHALVPACALGAALGLAQWGWVGLAIGALLGGGCGEVVVRRRRRSAAQRHAARMTTGLPDALELLAAAVDGGASPDLVLHHVARFAAAPVGPTLARALRDAHDGDLGRALCDADPALRPLGALLRQSIELGVPVASSLRHLADDARAHARATARERAAAAGPRMLLVVGGLLAPAALLVVIGGQALVVRSMIGPVLG